jgi:hypothetical protein
VQPVSQGNAAPVYVNEHRALNKYENGGISPRILISAMDGGQLHAPTILTLRENASPTQPDGNLGVTLEQVWIRRQREKYNAL